MITLRKLEPSDLPYLYRWENDSAAWADGNNHHPLSQQDLRSYIASTTGDIYRDGQLRMMIVDSTGASVGAVDLYDLDVRNRKAAVGIYLSPEMRGRGIALEALGLLDVLAFRDLGLRLLYAFVSETNTSSGALFARAGYVASSPLPAWTLEGDAVLYTRMAESYRR